MCVCVCRGVSLNSCPVIKCVCVSWVVSWIQPSRLAAGPVTGSRAFPLTPRGSQHGRPPCRLTGKTAPTEKGCVPKCLFSPPFLLVVHAAALPTPSTWTTPPHNFAPMYFLHIYKYIIGQNRLGVAEPPGVGHTIYPSPFSPGTRQWSQCKTKWACILSNGHQGATPLVRSHRSLWEEK